MRPADFFNHWGLVRLDLLEMLDRFEARELSYTPFPCGWPVGQIFLHIAECEDYWIHAVVRKELKAPIRYSFKIFSNCEDIKEVLAISHRRTEAYLNTLEEDPLRSKVRAPDNQVYTLQWILWHVLEHEIHHRGELSLIFGLLGRQGLDV